MNYICTYGDSCRAYYNGECKNTDEMCVYRKKRITNADYMRSLSNEELAHDIMSWIMSNQGIYDESGMEDSILYYLNQPYDGE